jgi:hypothetical protein
MGRRGRFMCCSITGDIWSFLGEGHIVIPTNLDGVMGRGIAKQARDKFPGIQSKYKSLISKMGWPQNGQARIIGIEQATVNQDMEKGLYFLMFPVKYHWREKANLDLIEEMLRELSQNDFGDKDVYLPLLGCGFGGLDIGEVMQAIDRHLEATNFVLVLRDDDVQEKYPESFAPGIRIDTSLEVP